MFQVDEDDYDELDDQLYDLVEELWNEFKQSEHEPWSTFTITFDSSNHFKINYGYEDLMESDSHERKLIWDYEYLCIDSKSDL